MIEVRDLHKAFGQEAILEGIDFQIPDDTKLCVLGRSGSGKSVLVKLILGLLELDRGDILIDGDNIRNFERADWEDFMQKVGVVFQGAALFDSLTIDENVGLKLYEERQHTKVHIQQMVGEALQQVQLSPDIMGKYPEELSGGMQKRVGIARAIIRKPQYLVYDEPTTGLDPIGAAAIDDLIISLAPKRTTIVITHDMESVKKLADQVVLIHEKQLRFSGKLDAFLSSNDPLIQTFLNRDMLSKS